MFTTYKNLFCSIVSCFKNEFSGIENKQVPGEIEDKENNGTNIDNLVTEILKDRRLDKDDTLLLDNLINEFNSLKEKNLEKSYNATKELMSEVLENVIENGYEINSEADYEMFKKSNKAFLDGKIQLPEYDAKIFNDKVLVSDTASKRIYINEQSLAFGSSTHFIENGKISKIKDSSDSNGDFRFNDNKIDVDSLISKQSDLFNTLTNDHKDFNNKLENKLNSVKGGLEKIEEQRNKYKDNQEALNRINKVEELLNQYIEKSKLEGKDNTELYEKYITEVNSLGQYLENINLVKNTQEKQTKVETKKEKVSSSNLEGSRVDNENISWNINEFNSKGITLINKQLGVSGDAFTKETLKKVYEISTDGKIGLGVLKKLNLVDSKNNAINGLTKEMFQKGQLEKGNSSKIIFSEKVESVKKPEKTTIEVNKSEKEETKTEENKKVEQKEDSVMTDIKEGFNDAGEYISEKFNSLKEWIKELFETDENLAKFVGKNGLEVGIDYDKENNKIVLDTSYFDSVLDYEVDGMPKDVDTKEEALAYVKSQISKIKEVYDNKTAETDLKNSIAHKQRMKEDFGHELEFTKEELDYLSKQENKKEEKVEVKKEEEKVKVEEKEIKIDKNISLKYDSKGLEKVISGLSEGSSDYKAEIGSFGNGEDITKHEQKINVYQMAGKTYLEVESGSLWKGNPDMRIKSEKDINEKNIKKLISELDK